MKKGNGRFFYADEKQFGTRREGRRVSESSKQIKMEMFPLLLNTPVSKLPAGVWGARRGRRGGKEEERIGVGGRWGEGGEMSQLCLTGLRAELCGLMLGGGGCVPPPPPPPPLHEKKNRHTHTGGGGMRMRSSQETVWSRCPGQHVSKL